MIIGCIKICIAPNYCSNTVENKMFHYYVEINLFISETASVNYFYPCMEYNQSIFLQ